MAMVVGNLGADPGTNPHYRLSARGAQDLEAQETLTRPVSVPVPLPLSFTYRECDHSQERSWRYVPHINHDDSSDSHH